MSNLTLRVLVAIVGIPLIVALVIAGSWWLAVFIALVSALGAGEFYSLAQAKGATPHTAIGIATAAALPLALAVDPALVPPVLTVACMATFVAQLRIGPDRAIASVGATALGMLYPPLLLGWILPLRQWSVTSPDDGAWLLLVTISGIWMCDTAAYFVGRWKGKHPLSPRTSPKKTWEGALGGLLASVVWCWVFLPLMLGWATPWVGIAIGVIIGTVGQAGDVAKSLLKRDAGVKDSSALIPGHGGVLDRFDSLTATVPAVYGLLVLLRIASLLP
ncbi:MAG: phosphatidate cytidylyltransferase [Chlorobiota bacterium]|jgi:phosphatidate cytidylyltransferase|nr:MAG: phosphatidate cytidylyltransferase [Chlorobiota bacterium]